MIAFFQHNFHMRSKRRSWTKFMSVGSILACAFALAGCAKKFEVSAVFISGKLAFVGDDDKETFAPWCLNNFSISDENGEKMWEIDAHEAYRSARRCGPNLPIIYGEGPKGAKTVVPARALVPGRTYIIDGYGGGIYEGVFQYTVQRVSKVKNMDTDQPQVRAIINHMFEADRRKIRRS